MSRLPFLPAVEDVSSLQLGWPSLVLAPGQPAMFCAGVRVAALFCSSLPKAGRREAEPQLAIPSVERHLSPADLTRRWQLSDRGSGLFQRRRRGPPQPGVSCQCRPAR